MRKQKIILLIAPTASGKSALALQLARRLPVEIVSADSMQVYRLMDIGTAKPSREERAVVPHHLLDLVWPDEAFDAARFQKEADRAIREIAARDRVPLVVGGTGLYLKALLHGLFQDPSIDKPRKSEDKVNYYNNITEEPYILLERLDPETARRIHPNDTVRVTRALDVIRRTGRSIRSFQQEHGFVEQRYDALILGLAMERESLNRRIEERVDAMMVTGFLDEVQGLLDAGYDPELPSMKALGYRHLVPVVLGETPLETAVNLVKRDTKRYAKRQRTWFRHQEEVSWLDGAWRKEEIFDRIQAFLGAQ